MRCLDCGTETNNVDPPTCAACRTAASTVARRCTCTGAHHTRGLTGLHELVEGGHDGTFSIDDAQGRSKLVVTSRAEAEALLADWAVLLATT